MLIKISDIAVIQRQRKQMDPDKLRELANDIEKYGLLHPIVVRDPLPGEGEIVGDKPYVLSVGGRRMAAHILLHREEIEANHKRDLDPISARIVELNENLQRENLTWQEELDARAEIAELVRAQNPGAVHSEVAAVVGVSEAQLSKDLSLQKLIQKDPSLKTAASKGAAFRTASFKVEIQQRIDNVQATAAGKLDDLRRRIHTADGRDFIRRLPTDSIDLVFSDLPYGIDYFAKVEDATKGVYDDSSGTAKDFIIDVLPECLRVVKPGGWVVFFMCYEWHGWLQEEIHNVCQVHHQYRTDPSAYDQSPTYCMHYEEPSEIKEPCSFYRPEMPPWIWTRRGRGNHGHWPELHAANRYEMIVVVNGGQAKLAKKPVENVLDFPPFEGERLHAMQKPHELCQEIIARTTVIGERVLDICYGSGAHLAAAASMGRDFIGCDINPDNLGPAISLVAQHYSKEAQQAIERGKTPLSLVTE